MTAAEHPAATAPPLFDTEPCARCGGSGRFSYNQLDGDRCYGCGGTGKQIIRAHRAMAAEWQGALNTRRRAAVKDLAPGDQIAADGGWRTVAGVDIDHARPCGWIGRERTPHAWRAVVRFADGTTIETSSNALQRRRALLADVLPLVSSETAAHIRARRP